MNLVSPSILSCDFLNIEPDLKNFESMKDIWMHLDIMDGHFVPNLTFGPPIIKLLCSKLQIPMDAHLMVTNPKWHIEEMKDYGLHNITFHLEAVDNSLELVRLAKQSYPSVGISIKPKTEVSALSLELLKEIDLVLVMSVEPGFGGQGFIDNSLEKIKELGSIRKEKSLGFQIQVDGGVNAENAKIIRSAGADNLVAGSFIFKNLPQDYEKSVQLLRS
tara:strand:+ start:82613 stop:83266 length:654 start_codon:yes stop_codon:yes gene_type:complete